RGYVTEQGPPPPAHPKIHPCPPSHLTDLAIYFLYPETRGARPRDRDAPFGDSTPPPGTPPPAAATPAPPAGGVPPLRPASPAASASRTWTPSLATRPTPSAPPPPPRPRPPYAPRRMPCCALRRPPRRSTELSAEAGPVLAVVVGLGKAGGCRGRWAGGRRAW